MQQPIFWTIVGAAAFAWVGCIVGMLIEGLADRRWRGLPMWLGTAAGGLLGVKVGRSVGQDYLDFSIQSLLATTSLVTKILLVVSLAVWLLTTVSVCMEIVRIHRQKLDKGISLMPTPFEWIFLPLLFISCTIYDENNYGFGIFLLGIFLHLLYMLCAGMTGFFIGRRK